MSTNNKIEENNVLQKQFLTQNNIFNNNLNNEPIIKKNKIINIKIYQNYSSSKNSNSFYPNINNILNLNDSQKITNEIGIQTDLEKDNKIILLTDNNLNKNINCFNKSISHSSYQFSNNLENKNSYKSFKSAKLIKSERKRNKKFKSIKKQNNNKFNTNKIYENKSHNLKNKKANSVGRKQNKELFKYNSFQLFEVNNFRNKNDKNKINFTPNKNEEINTINISQKKKIIQNNEKNKIAKEFSLFNLKNNNNYLIINDGNYYSNYKEKNKLSINDIYSNGINEFSEIKSIQTHNQDNYYVTNQVNSYNNYFQTYKCRKQHKSNHILNSRFNLDKNRKLFNKSNNKIIKSENKILKKFNDLFIENCKDLFIYNSKINKKENNNLNNTNNNPNHMKNNYYSKLVKNINDNLNQYLSTYISKGNKNTNINETKKPNIQDITKFSVEIISSKDKLPEKNPIKNKVKLIMSKEKNDEPIKKSEKQKSYKQLNDNKKKGRNFKLDLKFDSFLLDITKEGEDKDILLEDLLKTYTEESERENKSYDNKEKIGDEKAFFNSSKIPKIEEFKYSKNLSSNRNRNTTTINNIILSEKMNTSRRNKSQKINKINFTNILNKLHQDRREKELDYGYEYKFLNNLTNKRNQKINKDNKLYEKLLKEKKQSNINNHHKCEFIFDEQYHKIKSKEKMYNFIFNEKISTMPYNKELRLDILENDNDVMINKLNTDIKSTLNNRLFKNYNHNIERNNDFKYIKERRNKSYRNSYSKYYLNKLEIENKYLIPTLNKKRNEYFY